MSTRLTRRVVQRAASYTIKHPMDAPGTIFTNRGASGSITFTLPTPTRAVLGVGYRFKVVADQDVVIAGAGSTDILTLNNAAAASVTVGTSSQKIGATVDAECVESAEGTFKWAVSGVAVGHTYTVA